MIQHNRTELLKRINELRDKPFESAMLDVAMTCRLTDEELCEVVQEVLRARERLDDRESAKVTASESPYDPRD